MLHERPILLLEDVGGMALAEQVERFLEPSRFLELALSPEVRREVGNALTSVVVDTEQLHRKARCQTARRGTSG